MQVMLISLLTTLFILPLSLFGKEHHDNSSINVSDKPNVLLIVVDDLGWVDVGYNDRSNVFNTPHIDKLAKKSALFTNAYAGAANCAPSRAVLMTGQYTPRHGIYTVNSSERGNPVTRKLVPTKNTITIPNNVITMADMFKQNGYHTATFGKWHLSDDPEQFGFDHNIAGNLKGHPKTYFSPYNLPNLKDEVKGEYLPDRITSEVIHWMKSVNTKPFFAYVPYFTVHTPLQAKLHIKNKYLSHPNIKNDRHATYAAMVESMDENIGRLLKSLVHEGLSKNTLVIFTSDNGGIRGFSSQSPLRGGKGSYYEGGTRVPLLVSWLEKIAPKRIEVPVTNADFFPTFMNIVNSAPIKQPLDGVDISQLLLTKQAQIENKLSNRSIFWHFPIYLQAYNASFDQNRDLLFRAKPGSSMRKGRWKLIHDLEDNAYELYDLKSDISEYTNLAQYHPQILNKLSNELHQWQKNIKAPIPRQENSLFDNKKRLSYAKQQLKNSQVK